MQTKKKFDRKISAILKLKIRTPQEKVAVEYYIPGNNMLLQKKGKAPCGGVLSCTTAQR